MILGVMAMFSSCTQQEPEVLSKAAITMTVDRFITEGDVVTKTNVDPANQYSITWAETDIIGIFPYDGFQEPFRIPANQVGNATATFDGGYWQIRDGLTYNAYYPFSKDNFSDWDALEHIGVSYVGQSQNGKECNAGAYDYTYSDWQTANFGKVSFAFHHIGSFIVLKLKLPATATYTGLTLNSSETNIPLRGTYDLTAASPAFVPDPSSLSNSISMALTNYSGTEGEDAVFYMMMPPVDLSSSTLRVILSTSEGDTSYSIESKNIVASRLYEFTGKRISGSADGTVDPWGSDEEDYVDLGLSVKWATCNLGASAPEGYGLYYQWGDTQGYGSDTSDGKYFYWKDDNGNVTYKWCNGSQDTMTKYNTKSSYGHVVDNKTVLDLEDDAAHVALGGKWRMPTDDEWTELIDNCTWTWTTEYGINGYRVTSKKTGFTDKSIFLPAAGYRHGGNLDDVGSDGDYWSSSLSGYMFGAYGVIFYSSGVYRNFNYRSFGQPIRPVYGDIVHVSSVSLNKTSLSLTEGDSETLIATVNPGNAAEKSVTWTSSVPGVVTVDATGKVTATKAGTATITVTTVDGSKTATCNVTIFARTSCSSEYVDLGLSVKWATCNLGASAPEGYGLYYQWGDTQGYGSDPSDGKYFAWKDNNGNVTYKWCNGSDDTLTKYNESSYYSPVVDNKIVLDLEDDAAHVALGGKWRMPTDAEWTELRDNCTWTWAKKNGIAGYMVTSNKPGYTDKWIFLPAAGYRFNDYLYHVGSFSFYWSSSLDTDNPSNAFEVNFNSSYVNRYFRNRCGGQSIRPVSE